MSLTDEQVFIQVGGRDFDFGKAKLVRLSLEQALQLPDAFNIVLADGLDWLKDDTFAMGKEVKIELGSDEHPAKTLLIGEVTGLLPTMGPDNEVLLQVRGYDKSHRLLRGRYSRSFINSTDSDIATRIAQEMGLGTDIEDTDEVYDYAFQYNETNLEFLQKRASAIGYQVGVFKGNLYFKPLGQPLSGEAAPRPVELEWGDALEEFEVSRTTPGQATEVQVHGWDPKTKKPIIGQARSSQSGPDTKKKANGTDAVKSAFSMDAPMTVYRSDIGSQKAAERLAQVVCDELNADYTTAEALAKGDPRLCPGADVEVSGIGILDGTYRISSAVHVFDERGYHTSFRVDGLRRPRPSLPAFETAPAPRGLSFAVGIVTNNEDTQNMGRVKVRFPMLTDLESDWCRLVSPMTGDGRGFFFLPEIEDEVLVAFDASMGGRPFVIGSLWNGKDAPPLAAGEAVKDRKVVRRTIKTGVRGTDGRVLGNAITLDDTAGEQKVVIEDRNGNQIAIESKGDTIKITSKGNIEIHAAEDIKITAGGKLNLEATAEAVLKGSTVAIN
jgi:phage protein D